MQRPLKKRSKNDAQSPKNDRESCTEALVKFLRKQLTGQSSSAEFIAAAIATWYLKHQPSPDAKVPTQAFLSLSLHISAAQMEQVWRVLIYDYQIIQCSRSRGTWFTAYKNSEHKRQIDSRINRAYGRPGANFYDPTLSGPAGIDKGWQNLGNHWSTAYQHYPCNDESVDKLELDMHLKPRFSTMLNYEFNEDELTFCGRYMTVLDRLIGKNGHLKGEVVVLRPDVVLQEEQEQTQPNMLHFFGFQGHELMLSELDDFCKTHSRVIVYYVPAFKFGFQVEDAESSWKSLIDLQKLYGFNVIVHDRYHLSTINTVIFNSLPATGNTFLYYIAPACLLHLKLAEINVLICPAKQMTVFKKNNPSLHDQVSITAAYGLSYLLRSGKLESIERSVKVMLKGRIEIAKGIILDSGLFVENHVRQPEGWFFYLELIDRTFPPDIIKRLQDLNQHVVEPIVFWTAPQFKKGIVISISSFDSDSSLSHHLKILMSDIKTIINPRVKPLTKTNNYEDKKN